MVSLKNQKKTGKKRLNESHGKVAVETRKGTMKNIFEGIGQEGQVKNQTRLVIAKKFIFCGKVQEQEKFICCIECL